MLSHCPLPSYPQPPHQAALRSQSSVKEPRTERCSERGQRRNFLNLEEGGCRCREVGGVALEAVASVLRFEGQVSFSQVTERMMGVPGRRKSTGRGKRVVC